MGQKVNPIGFRLGVSRDWSSRWYAGPRAYRQNLIADFRLRETLKERLKNAAVSQFVIERPTQNQVKVTVHSARPGIVIGKSGEDIKRLGSELAKVVGQRVDIAVEEIRQPEIEAQLVAENIAQQLEKRIMFRRAMKRAVQNAMRLRVQGIKVMVAGRLNGAEIARTEWYREGRVPLHTLRADIDYGFAEAFTTYGTIGIKVWVFKGEVFDKDRTRIEEAPARGGQPAGRAGQAPAAPQAPRAE